MNTPDKPKELLPKLYETMETVQSDEMFGSGVLTGHQEVQMGDHTFCIIIASCSGGGGGAAQIEKLNK